MPFSESVRLEAKQRAHFRCVFCEQISIIEIHHIIPESESNNNTFDNAVALCPNCHTTYGNNPDHRNLIRQRRDWWYSMCAKKEQTLNFDYALEQRVTSIEMQLTGSTIQREQNEL